VGSKDKLDSDIIEFSLLTMKDLKIMKKRSFSDLSNLRQLAINNPSILLVFLPAFFVIETVA